MVNHRHQWVINGSSMGHQWVIFHSYDDLLKRGGPWWPHFMEEFTLKHRGFDLGPGLGPEEVLRRHGNETFYADDTRGNYAHPKLGDYVQERCQGWG